MVAVPRFPTSTGEGDTLYQLSCPSFPAPVWVRLAHVSLAKGDGLANSDPRGEKRIPPFVGDAAVPHNRGVCRKGENLSFLQSTILLEI